MAAASKVREGSALMQEAVIHDYENAGYGGQSILSIGGMGTGKTTLNLEMIQRVTHLDSPFISKKDYLKAYEERLIIEAKYLKRHYSPEHIADLLPKLPCDEVPETVLYSGREFDYWHVFLNRESWPNFKPKPVRLHLPAGEDFHFRVPFGENDIREMRVDDIVTYYKDSRQLIKHILEGGINVWYPPMDYPTPDNILDDMDLTKFTGQKKLFMRPAWMNFELIYTLMKYGYQKHITYFIDEIHEVLPANPSGIHWNLCEWYSRKVSTELRRCHVSLFGTCHGLEMVDYRLPERTYWYIWTGMAFPKPKYSRVYSGVVQNLTTGTCVIERRKVQFGIHCYDRIPNQSPKMTVIRD